MAEPALIFIPDISGFTRFVNRTDVQHANHIISELLGVILASNQLDLALSELEGDAVLYYRLGPRPSPADLVAQVRRTFIDFHEFLKIIDRDRVCQCGACTTASGLTLKFVAHYGELDEVRIQDFLKLMGRDVILAHRLLKNEVPVREYLLATSALLEAENDEVETIPGWAHTVEHAEVLEELGPWEGRYVPLGSLMDEVPEPSDRRPLGIAAEDAQISLEIDAPIALVHEVLTDFDQRFEWAVGMKDSVADSPINRVGGVHTCVFENFEVHVMTVDHQAAPDGFHYAESGESGGVTVVTDFQLRERDGVTLLMANQILGGRDKAKGGLAAVVQGLRGRVVLVLANRGLARGLKQLKAYCERRHRDGSGAEEEVRAVAST